MCRFLEFFKVLPGDLISDFLQPGVALYNVNLFIESIQRKDVIKVSRVFHVAFRNEPTKRCLYLCGF